MDILDTLLARRDAILAAVLTTASAGFWAIVISSLIGGVFGLVLTYGWRAFVIPIRIYVDIVRGIPGLVMIFSAYYILGFGLSQFGVTLSPWAAGVIALSIGGSADVAEITRGAFQSIPRGQIEAARAIGLRFGQTIRYVLWRQAILQIVPPWTNTATELIKGTTLLSLIGVAELVLVTNQLVATSGNALYYFIAIGLLFFALNSVIQLLARIAENKLNYARR